MIGEIYIDDLVDIFDNGGETADRYTIVDVESGNVWGASENPSHPQGFGQYSMDLAQFKYRSNPTLTYDLLLLIEREEIRKNYQDYHVNSLNAELLAFRDLPRKAQAFVIDKLSIMPAIVVRFTEGRSVVLTKSEDTKPIIDIEILRWFNEVYPSGKLSFAWVEHDLDVEEPNTNALLFLSPSRNVRFALLTDNEDMPEAESIRELGNLLGFWKTTREPNASARIVLT